MSLITNIKKLASKRLAGKILGVIMLSAILLPSLGGAALGAETSSEVVTPTFVGECEDGAVGILCGVSVAIQNLLLGLLSVMRSLFGWVLSSMTHLTIWAIEDLGIKIITHQAVSDGFAVTRNIANTIFIIAIIVIAFATILRWHEYEAKKLLPKLIITALLVNFSLLAAGLMLDTSNIFTKFFIGADGLNAESIGEALSPNAFGAPAIYGAVTDLETFRARYKSAADDRGILSFAWFNSYSKKSIRENLGFYDSNGWTNELFSEQILDNPAELTKWLNKNGRFLKTSWVEGLIFNSALGAEIDIGQLWSQFIDILPRVIFSVFATFVAMLTMTAMFIMALIRNIWVVVLLIAMPLAWALRVLPKFEQYWQKWWEKFLNWGVIYLPTLSFFLYIAVTTSRSTKIKLEEGGASSFGRIAGLDGVTADFLGKAPNGTTPLMTSFVQMLIVIGIMVAGLKIAQAMGASGAGFFANLAPKGMRKIGMGLLKGTTATAGALAGGVAGLGFGGLRSLARKVAPSEKYKEYQDLIAIAEAEGDQAEVKKLKKAMGTFGSAFKGGAFFGGATGLGRDELNLYGKATGFLGEKLARFSFIPGVGAASEFFSKTSAAQREAIGRAKKEFDGRDEATRKNLYKAAVFKSVAHQAAALQAAKENHDHLPDELASKLADAVATLYPGVDRSKIDLLKEIAGHNPFGARGITGEKAQEVIKRADAEMGRSWDMSHWTEKQRKEALGIMSDALKRAVASKNDFNRDLMLRHSIERLGDISERMSDEQKRTNTLMLSDFAAVREGRETKEVMDRLEGHLETLAGKENEKLRESFEAGQKTALRFGQDVARVVTGVKSKSEHGHHGNLSDFEIRNMAKKAASAFFSALTAKSGGGSSGGAKKVADSHAGDGHHGH